MSDPYEELGALLRAQHDRARDELTAAIRANPLSRGPIGPTVPTLDITEQNNRSI